VKFQTSSQPQLIGFRSDFSERRVKALRTERNGANITAQLIRFNIRTQKYCMSISGALYKFRRDHRLPLRSMIRNGAAMMSVVTALQRFLYVLRLLRRGAISFRPFFPRSSYSESNEKYFSLLLRSIQHCTMQVSWKFH